MIELKIPCSPDQEDVIVDHFTLGKQLGMLPDERAWITAHVRKHYPFSKILAADLDTNDAEWVVQIEPNVKML
jgi:hypothetical protein